MVKGELPVKEGRVISNIYRVSDAHGTERMTSLPDRRADILDEGKVATTRFRQIALHIRKRRPSEMSRPSREKFALVELQPLTGRTHQLRVHLAEQLDSPIVGDIKYGRGQVAPGPLHLHSRKVILKDYPEPGKRLVIEAPPPSHFVRTMLSHPLFLRKRPVFPKRKLKNMPRDTRL